MTFITTAHGEALQKKALKEFKRLKRETVVTHDSKCKYRESNAPVSELPCDCYKFFWYLQGFMKGAGY